jgi:hypothetical protein
MRIYHSTELNILDRPHQIPVGYSNRYPIPLYAGDERWPWKRVMPSKESYWWKPERGKKDGRREFV